MSDVAAVVVAVAAVVAVGLLAVAVAAAVRTMREVRETVDEFRRETMPVVADLQHAVKQANLELDRVGGVMGSAESVSATVDSFSHLVYLVFSNPLIKLLALGSGTARAVKALRRGD